MGCRSPRCHQSRGVCCWQIIPRLPISSGRVRKRVSGKAIFPPDRPKHIKPYLPTACWKSVHIPPKPRQTLFTSRSRINLRPALTAIARASGVANRTWATPFVAAVDPGSIRHRRHVRTPWEGWHEGTRHRLAKGEGNDRFSRSRKFNQSISHAAHAGLIFAGSTTNYGETNVRRSEMPVLRPCR